MEPYVIALFVIVGLQIGSFLNVVIYRVPTGRSLVRPGSACPTCGAAIRPWDNVPVVSFVLLRGRCRGCAARISARYPVVEAITGALWGAVAARFDAIEEAALVALSGSILIALSAIDLEHRRLPNVIVLPAILVSAAWLGAIALWFDDSAVFMTGLACGAAAFVLFFLIAFVSGGMGFGDVKLAALVGFVTGRFGWEVSVGAVFASFLVGGLVALVLLIGHRTSRKAKVPFGPSLAAGTLIALFAGPAPVRAWLGL